LKIDNSTNERLRESQRKARVATAMKLIEEPINPGENNAKLTTKRFQVEIEPQEQEKSKLSKKDIIIITIFVIAGFFLALLIMPEVIDDFERVLK
jgi:hypothetical protein